MLTAIIAATFRWSAMPRPISDMPEDEAEQPEAGEDKSLEVEARGLFLFAQVGDEFQRQRHPGQMPIGTLRKKIQRHGSRW